MSDVGGLCRLPEIVGPQKAAELLFTGELFDGEAAVDMGLAMKVVPHDELLSEGALANKIASNPRLPCAI